ncbi:MAG TPA: FtsX-like permease family protein [Steroidobacteraceae bacterium]|jgi:putative ABC transport system permease protein
MDILPILRALRRNKVGAILICLQIALTLAIVSNSLSIIQQRIAQMHRPSGIDEANIFTLSNTWVVDPDDLEARIKADLGALRALPGVVDAVATNSYPLRGGGWGWGLSLKPDQKHPTASTTEYFVDDHALAAYGIQLVAGRWFTPDEVGKMHINDEVFPSSIVITRPLAKALFPSGNALGQVVYFTPASSSRIVGIVAKTQTPWASGGIGESAIEYSTFMPLQFLNNGVLYVIRAMPGRQAEVMRTAQAKLYSLTRQRVIQAVQPFSETRAQAYRTGRATSVMLGTVCALLLAITAFGIVGLTMYWVNQRRRFIGMRRALGARRVDILSYFHLENLLIAGTGCILGVALGLGSNTWLARNLELTRMSVAYIGIGALIVLVLCQAAVVWPALRAASIAPAVATRAL